MLLRTAKIDAVHVPFTGGALAVTALLAGEVDFFFDPGPALEPAPRMTAEEFKAAMVREHAAFEPPVKLMNVKR
jgi:tripartite-type tricarboxylate transporter receptor subunit TctC